MTLSASEFWLTAANWGSFMHNGDPGACMYGFDESGHVQNEAHRQKCIAYIESNCRAAADLNAQYETDNTDHAELDAMVAYLITAPTYED